MRLLSAVKLAAVVLVFSLVMRHLNSKLGRTSHVPVAAAPKKTATAVSAPSPTKMAETAAPTKHVPTRTKGSCMTNKLAEDLTAQHHLGAAEPCRKFIGIVVPVTSRKQNITNVDHTAFMDSLVPSILSTLQASEDTGFDFAIYLGYDIGAP